MNLQDTLDLGQCKTLKINDYLLGKTGKIKLRYPGSLFTAVSGFRIIFAWRAIMWFIFNTCYCNVAKIIWNIFFSKEQKIREQPGQRVRGKFVFV